nr:PIH1 domain containing protein 2 [Hymenolepis microstoma]
MSEIDGIWKMLDEMATTDPASYQKFIVEQLKKAPEILSQPQCKGFLRCTLKSSCSIFINLCEWQLIDKPESDTAPIPFYCGSIYSINNGKMFVKFLRALLAKAIIVAMHPSVFAHYNISQTVIKQNSDINQLLTLVILFIKHEKNIYTMEWEEINAKNLVQFDITWCSEPYGGESEMLKSLHHRKFLVDTSEHPLKSKNIATLDVPTNIEPKIELSPAKLNENPKLIQEVSANPYWQLNKRNRKPNTCQYDIILPMGSKMEDCVLDISEVSLDRISKLFLRQPSHYK